MVKCRRRKYDPNGNHKWEWTEEGKARLSAMRMGACNPCWKGGWTKDKNAKAEYLKQWRKDNEDHVRNREYGKRFGITKADYDRLLIQQDSACAICKLIPKRRRLDVDHCHDTGRVRGLLCETCNKALGQFEDNPELLRAAIQYLQPTTRAPVRAKVTASGKSRPPTNLKG